MNAMNEETSLTEAADPVSVFVCSNSARLSGSVAFNGLEKGTAMSSKQVLATCIDCEHEWLEVFFEKAESLVGECICPECKSENIDILGYSKVRRG